MSERGRKAIWAHDSLYSFLRPYVDLCTRLSYRKMSVQGRMPQGVFIISPNHTNTLMDALVVLRLRKEATAFGARADIFRKPLQARALRFLKILPMVRRRDGLREVLRNVDTFLEIDDCLAHGVPFCIFPEGRHHTDTSVLALQNGVAKLAIRSALQRPTLIQPVGIAYDDFFHYRPLCSVRIGEPFDINAFIAGRDAGDERELIRPLLEELHSRMETLIEPLPPRRRNVPLAVLTAPFALLAALESLPMWVCAEVIVARLADRAFSNTVRFAVRLVGTPLFLALWAAAFFLLLPWPVACALLVYFLFSYSITYDWWNLVRK